MWESLGVDLSHKKAQLIVCSFSPFNKLLNQVGQSGRSQKKDFPPKKEEPFSEVLRVR